jgi:hypothetical protein
LQNLERGHPFFSLWGKRNLFTKDHGEKRTSGSGMLFAAVQRHHFITSTTIPFAKEVKDESISRERGCMDS